MSILVLSHTHQRKNTYTKQNKEIRKLYLMKIPFSYFENHQLNEFRVRGNRGQGYQRMRSAEIIISTIMKDFKPKTTPSTQKMSCTWDKPFKNGPSKICGRQALKNFTWSILEYLNTYNDS